MKIKNPKTEEEIYIYSARLTFVREKNGYVKDIVYVTIHYSKSKKELKDLLIPKEIDTDGLNWRKKNDIAVYYRDGDNENYDYTPINKGGGVPAPTGLSQKLEDLIKEACFGNSEQK